MRILRSHGITLTALLCSLAFLFFVQIGNAAAQEGGPGDQTCLDCHGRPAQVISLPNGEQLYISIDADDFASSVHGQESITCTACHSEISEYPHPAISAQSRRAYTIEQKDTCLQCHADKSSPDDIHAQLLAEGNQNAAVCADCHNPHTQTRLTGQGGGLIISKGQIAQTCATCHSAIYNEYAQSVHGKAAIEEGNQDVPACTDCHGVHQIHDPRTAEYRLNSPQMCANCHTNKEIMDRYGLSTAVYETYVADFHGTTVTLFQKESPDAPSNKAVCFDCHGVHDIASMKDPERSLQVKQNILTACQRCHPGATENFPDSWLSHYIPDKHRTPLVYYVNLFYKFFIPAVIVPMSIFVLSDIFRKLTRPRAYQEAMLAEQKKEEQPEEEGEAGNGESSHE